MGVDKRKTFCVGLTGGIGSGKTTVADFFAKLNVPIFDADIIAKQLVEPYQPAYETILSHFGDQVVNADQTLNRQRLREIIFSNPTEKKWLENLLHPRIRQAMQKQVDACQAAYCICVIPLLAESTGFTFVDRILAIETPHDIQIKRAMTRDCMDETLTQKIIQTQASLQKRRAIADDLIVNNGTLKMLKDKVLALHQYYLQLITRQYLKRSGQ